MIAELLDLADRLQIPTPRPFEVMRVHYFIDLSEEGEILSITPRPQWRTGLFMSEPVAATAMCTR